MRRTHALIALTLACCLTLPAAGCGHSAQGPASAEQGTTAQESSSTQLVDDFRDTDIGCGWEPIGSMELAYARRFTVDYFEGGYQLACLADGNRYLIVPEGAEAPEGLAEDIIVLEQPVSDIYLVASDSMCLFDALGALDRISVSGIERDDWSVAAAREAMDAGTMVYGGKYRAPDYELLVSRGVRLAIESTMINHTPDVRDKLMELGIPVLVELSSYEGEPLGRAEWIRLYGALLGLDDVARERFQEQMDRVASIDGEPTNLTVAYFYLNSNGAAVVRRPGDYVTAIIEQAGGTYAFNDLEPAAAGSSSVTMQMEQFYATAKDADIVIYNSSIDDSVTSLDSLLARNELLGDFKAVQTGNVWATQQNMYQQMMASGDIILDFNRILHGATGELTYLHQLT